MANQGGPASTGSPSSVHRKGKVGSHDSVDGMGRTWGLMADKDEGKEGVYRDPHIPGLWMMQDDAGPSESDSHRGGVMGTRLKGI